MYLLNELIARELLPMEIYDKLFKENSLHKWPDLAP